MLTSAPLPSQLTAAEQAELTRLETVIQKGWTTFLDVGHALMKIQQARLYRDRYETFDSYVREQLDMSRSHAYNLINSTEVFDELSAMADILVKPANERQIRGLIALPKDKRAVTWKKVVNAAAGKPVTAKLVNRVAAEFKPKTGKPATVVKKSPVAGMNLQPAFKLIDDIEKLAGKDRRLLAKVAALRECLENLAEG